MLETRKPKKRIELMQPIQPIQSIEQIETIEQVQQLLDRLVLSGLGVTILAVVLLITLGAG